jgi:hypothetical protein
VRRTCPALLAALFLAATPAVAQQPGGGTAPAYPGNTLELRHPGPIVAGTVVTVRLSGHAEWNEATGPETIPFTLSMYAQDADVDGACSPSYGQQLTKSINLPGLNASASITGFVLSDDFTINPSPPSTGIDWAIDSVPFAIRPGIERVLLCGYQRYVIDDVAWFQLPVRIAQPACRALRGSVTRPARLRLRCNVSGRATVILRRAGKARVVSTRISSRDGGATVPTRRLGRGTYSVSVRIGQLALGGSFRVRVR